MEIKTKIKEWIRVLQVARKPGKDEFMAASKICIIGITLVGVIGFLIFLLFTFVGI